MKPKPPEKHHLGVLLSTAADTALTSLKNYLKNFEKVLDIYGPLWYL